MMKLNGFSEWRVEDYLKTAEQRAAFLNAAIEDADPCALGPSFRCVAEEVGVEVEGGDLSLRDALKVIKASGLRIEAKPVG